MRDRILLYINGKRTELSGEQAFAPITDFVRYQCQQTGTKVVCAEGDCGACTMLLGRLDESGELSYRPINACIQYGYQLDCCHLVTVEGLKVNNTLNAVQESMVTCQGAQCGYCTPGIVVALCGLFNTRSDRATAGDVREALTGNLCRCTGYDAIIQAGMSVDPAQFQKLPVLYPTDAMRAAFEQHRKDPVTLSWEDRQVFLPTTIAEAVAFKQQHPNTVIISGGTDVSVFCNKRDFEPRVVMSLCNLPGLDTIELRDGEMVVGARASLVQLEQYIAPHYPEVATMLERFGSPQIKHAATLAGNIANGSPIADSLPFLFVIQAEVELTGTVGTRRVNLNHFYTGYKANVMQPDELITRVFIPIEQGVLKLYKVSRRCHLDISTFAAAIWLRHQSNQIEDIRIAYGGVGPTVIRLARTEAFLKHKALSLNVFESAGQIACEEISPISDVRGDRRYRLQLAQNILLKFFHELEGVEVPV